MIQHKLMIFGAGHDPKPELNDFEVVHIIYKLETLELDESNNVLKFASTGLQVANLDPWNLETKIPGNGVTKEILEQWLSEKVDLEQLKLANVENLQLNN